MLGRVGHVEAAGNRGDRMPGPQRAVVGRRVDAAGEAGDDDQCMREVGGEVLRHVLAVGRGVAAADQGHGASRQQRGIAQNGQNGGRIVQQGEQRRVVGLGREDQPRTEPANGFQFAGRIGNGRDRGRRLPSTGARKGGQRIQRRGGGLVARQQTPIRHRADTFRARKAQPVQRIGRRQFLTIMLFDQCVARCRKAAGGCSRDDGRTPARRSPTQA